MVLSLIGVISYLGYMYSFSLTYYELIIYFYPPGSKCEALQLGVHLILLYFIPRRRYIYICPRVHLMSLNIYSLWVTKFGFQKHGRWRAFFEPRKFLLGGWWMVDGGWTMSWHGAAWAASRLKRLQEPLRGSKNNNPSGLRPKRPRSRCAAPDTISDFRLF